ncbi:nicotinamidase-like [Parasteatoda tepidariorum]|uniref:nicotinamidase-like n=1 Tax=Parasteatoda tepidariorum TaxID=114398 RepID=UPI00077FDD54|nr:nicotinamidase-like [Parasteatoda tepidariorum]
MANFFDDLLNEYENIAEEKVALDCLHLFDRDGDDCLSLRELCSLMRELFVDGDGKSYELAVRMCAEMFYVFDTDRDGIICREEFLSMWPSFVLPILQPKSALIIIDVQNDFIDGSLAIRNCPAGQEGKEVVPVINELLENVPFNYVFYTYDWHPEDHVSFVDNVHLRKFHKSCSISADEAKIFDTVTFSGPPKIEQKLWPKHCVQESWGAELHPELTIAENAIFIYKGTCPDIDSYSAFWDNQKLSQTNLSEELSSRGVTDVYLCGLATEYCVRYTSLHSLEHGYRTILIEDACRGVALEDIQSMKEELVVNHGVIVNSDKVRNMVIGRDRRLDLGYRTAMSASPH